MSKFNVKLVTSLEKVLPKREPSGEGFKNPLTALLGESISFQIAYGWNDWGRQNGTVHVNAPKELQVNVRTVGLVPCAYPSHLEADEQYLSTEPGLYPDILCEMTERGFPIVSGQWRSLWVEVEALETGIYPIEIELRSLEWKNVLEKLTINIEVIPTKSPKNPIYHTEWFHCDCLANYYGVEVFSERHWEIIENFVKTAVKRGCNMLLTPIFTPPLDTAVGGERRTVQLIDVNVKNEESREVQDNVHPQGEGELPETSVKTQMKQKTQVCKYEFSYEKFERWVEMCKCCGVTYFEISHLFTQWGATFAPKIVATVNGVEQKIFGWETKASSLEYKKFLGEFLKSFTVKLEEMGIAENCFFHLSDEPNLEQLESYKMAKETVQEYLQGYRMIDALSDYKFFEQGLVSEPICGTNHLKEFLEKRPEHLWAYYCTGQSCGVSNRFIAQRATVTRILGLQLYKFEIDGFLQWGYNFYNSQFSRCAINPYHCTDAGEAFPSGDPFIVYPGVDGKPEESLRIMLMQEAFQDFAAMKYLESLAGREAVLECLMEDRYGELKFDQYPLDISYILEVRERINQKIGNYSAL